MRLCCRRPRFGLNQQRLEKAAGDKAKWRMGRAYCICKDGSRTGPANVSGSQGVASRRGRRIAGRDARRRLLWRLCGVGGSGQCKTGNDSGGGRPKGRAGLSLCRTLSEVMGPTVRSKYARAAVGAADTLFATAVFDLPVTCCWP